MIADHPLCPGEPCVKCAWCSVCNRVVGEPHLPVCACSTPDNHYLCNWCSIVMVPYDGEDSW